MVLRREESSQFILCFVLPTQLLLLSSSLVEMLSISSRTMLRTSLRSHHLNLGLQLVPSTSSRLPSTSSLRLNSTSSSSTQSQLASTKPTLSRNETYFRRVTKPDQGGPLPSRWQRGAQLLGGILAVVSTSYFVLWADFGEREHCFSPVSYLLGSSEMSGLDD